VLFDSMRYFYVRSSTAGSVVGPYLPSARGSAWGRTLNEIFLSGTGRSRPGLRLRVPVTSPGTSSR
jgi:hypothetical protein